MISRNGGSPEAHFFLDSKMRKPFDVLAEGLVSEKSRGDKTAIELFLSGVRGWEGHVRRQLDDGKPKAD
jgi:hypothetical protein